MPEQILDVDIERAISDVTRRKHADMLQFIAFVEHYGLSEVALWLRNIERDMAGSLAVGMMGDPRR
jgi:hypothetical protein